MRFKCLCFLALLIAACGTGESDSSELQTMTKLLIPGVVEDADWLFEVDSDATLQMSRCLSIYLIETLGLTTNDLRTYLEENSTMAKSDALETLIAEKESEVEASEDDIWATMGCFEDNARTTDFMRLMSSAMSDFAEGLETLSEDLKTEPVPTSVTPTQPPTTQPSITQPSTTQQPAPPATYQPPPTVAEAADGINGWWKRTKERRLTNCNNLLWNDNRLLFSDGGVLWYELGFTQNDYDNMVIDFCKCKEDYIVNEFTYSEYQKASPEVIEKEKASLLKCEETIIDPYWQAHGLKR
jgi:hypothetical protein